MSRLEKMKMRRIQLTDNGETEFISLAKALRKEKTKKQVDENNLSADALAEYFSTINKK